MSQDWLARDNQGVIDQGKLWLEVMGEETTNSKGEKVLKWKAWGLSEDKFLVFSNAFAAAQEAFEKTKSGDRSEAAFAVCRDAIKALKASMRVLKKRWLFEDPVSREDLARMKFAEIDRIPTNHGEADAVYEIEIISRGLGRLKVRTRMAEGDPKNPANHLKMLYYKIIAPGEKPPETQRELTELVLVTTVTHEFNFGPERSGSKVFLAVCTGKDKISGNWGPMISAVIP